MCAIVIVEEKDSSPVPVPEAKPVKEDVEMEDKPRTEVPKEALVPFCNPLADEKQTKKVLKSVRKGQFFILYVLILRQQSLRKPQTNVSHSGQTQNS